MKGCRPLSPDEIRTVLNSFKGEHSVRDKALFVLGIRTGFRISEILSLRVEDVVHRGRIADRVYVKRRNMKGKIEGRSVPLHAEAKVAVESWVSELQKRNSRNLKSYLFPSRKKPEFPLTRSQAWRILSRLFQRNNLGGKLGTHTLRKTFAAVIYERLHGDLFKLQAALSHRSINSTISYCSFRLQEIENAVLEA